MARSTLTSCLVTTLAASWLAGAPPVLAEQPPEDWKDQIMARDDRIADLEAKFEILADELASVRTQVAVPDEPELKAAYGYGPAASKIYGIERGLSVGGYAEGFYRKFVGDQAGELDTWDNLRTVLYVGYKFTDRIIFNTEIEWEHASSSATASGAGAGSVSVEFASLDLLWRDEINFRTGLLLAPIGFINEVHEPPFFHGVDRPEVESVIIPTTWRENGAGIFGRLGEDIEYRAYVMNTFNAQGFGASGIRGGRQKGNRALAEDLAGVIRIDWTPTAELVLGGSVFMGNTGQDLNIAGMQAPEADMVLWELHGQYRRGGFEGRALFAMTHLDDAGALTRVLQNSGDVGAAEAISSRMLGGYLEGAYDIWGLLFPGSEVAMLPFLRVEYFDTQADVPDGFSRDRSNQVLLFTPGVTYKPHPNVVLKMDYRNFDSKSGDKADELSFGFGLAF